MADSFSALMYKALSNSLIEGFQIGGDGVQVSHLQFADDTICFIKDSEEQVVNLKLILSIFKTISRFKVNYAKSSLLGIGWKRWCTDLHPLWVVRWSSGQ